MTTLRRRLTSIPRPLTARHVIGYTCLIAGTLSLLGFLTVWSLAIWAAFPLTMRVLSALVLLYIAFWLVYRGVPTVRGWCKGVSRKMRGTR